MKLSTSKSLWLYEILNIDGVETIDVLDDFYIPAMSVFEISVTAQRVKNQGGGILQLCASKNTDVFISARITGNRDTKITLCEAVVHDTDEISSDAADPLTALKLKNSLEERRYTSGFLHTVLSEHKFLVGSHDIHLIDPSFGNASLPRPNQKTIAICTPCFERTRLLKLYVDYMTSYYIPYLQMKGLNAILVLTGSQVERDAIVSSLNTNYVFIWHDNNLGAKKNIMLDFARSINADYVSYIDSDDFIHPDTTLKLTDIADRNGYWSAIEPFVFFDAKDKKHGLFEGYAKDHSLYKWGMGSGRVFTKPAIEKLGKNPFAKVNKSMDYYIREQLSELDVPHTDRILNIENCPYIPVGLKSSENIWAYDRYKMKELTDFETWLPPAILSEFMEIPYDATEDESQT